MNMKMEITIDMDNAAFEHANGYEVARILTKLAHSIEGSHMTVGDKTRLLDINGNRVGDAQVAE
jgi:hypothetical protein